MGNPVMPLSSNLSLLRAARAKRGLNALVKLIASSVGLVHCAAAQEVARPSIDTGWAARVEFKDADVRQVIRAMWQAGFLDVVVPDRFGRKVSVVLDPRDPTRTLDALGGRQDEHGVFFMGSTGIMEFGGMPKRGSGEVDVLEVREALCRIAESAEVPLVIGPGVDGHVPGNVVSMGWRQVLSTFAARGISVGDAGDVVVAVRAPERYRSLFVFEDVDAGAVIQAIAAEGGVSVAVEEGLRGRVTLRTANVSWRHALSVVAASLQARVTRNEDGSYRIEQLAKYRAKDLISTETVSSDGMSVATTLEMIARPLRRPFSVSLSSEVMEGRVIIRGLRVTRDRFAQIAGDACGVDMIELASGDLRFERRACR